MKKIIFFVLFLLFEACSSKIKTEHHELTSITINIRDSLDTVITKDPSLIKEFQNQIRNNEKADDLFVFVYKYIAKLNYDDSTETMYISEKYYKINGIIFKADNNLGATCDKIIKSR